MPINVEFLQPVLILVVWTLIVWMWMYATRIPAMQAAQINPDDARHPGTYAGQLPPNVRAAADNYNHLHEQPTIFYALMVFAALTGGADVTDARNLCLPGAMSAFAFLHSLDPGLVTKSDAPLPGCSLSRRSLVPGL